MQVIQGRNVNKLFPLGVDRLALDGVKQSSRNGDTLEFATPVTSVYERPTERVLFDAVRDANPFLHLFDGLYCLAGRNDVAWIARFGGKMADYSDDGTTFNGAYGYRWRHQYSFDQLLEVVTLLQREPDTRRAVIQMWEPDDLKKSLPGGIMSRDVPCNTAIFFKIRNGLLNMTVCNRSNDMIWGAYGANVVQFSMLQEYVAALVGVDVGVYYQVSDSLHAYTDVFDKVRSQNKWINDAYETGEVAPFKMVHAVEDFDHDLQTFVSEQGATDYANPFFTCVAEPMRRAWFHYKNRDRIRAVEAMTFVTASDWRKAGTEWLARRGFGSSFLRNQ